MSISEVAVGEEMRQAMCLQCGAVRSAKTRYIGRGARGLRCQVCRLTTTHAAVNWDGADPREDDNADRSRHDAEVSQQLAELHGLFRSCGIQVLSADSETDPENQPQGDLVDVIRWLEPEGYLVRLQGDLSPAEQAYCLDWAWRSLRPRVARWERCLVELDLDGQPFQRVYNNEREAGNFPTA